MTRSVYGSDGVGTNTWWGLGTSGTVVAGDVVTLQQVVQQLTP